MSALRCTTEAHQGITNYRAPSGELVARRFPGGGVCDLRKAPPYLQILPCPYCGVEEDREHDPLSHVNWTLGTPVR